MPRFLFSAGLVLLAAASAHAATLESAKVTLAVNQVLIAPPDQSPKPAAEGDVLTGKASLETGKGSRAELVFNDQTIARVGANSVFSFFRGTRELELNQGVIFMQVPKNAGGATIQTAAVTAAITGTTIAIEYSPKNGNSKGAVKILVLEGTLRVFLKSNPGESLLLEPGQMISLEPDAKSLPEPEVFDIDRLVKTSGLLGKPFRPLPSLALIDQSINRQNKEKKNGKLVISNYVLHAEIPGGIANFQDNNGASTLRTLVLPPTPGATPVRAPVSPPPPPPTPLPTPQKIPPTPPPRPGPSPIHGTSP
jgi:hypothetical protein